MNKEKFKTLYINKLNIISGKSIDECSIEDKYNSLISLIKDFISKDWIKTSSYYKNSRKKQVYYFSMEFLPGKLVEQYLIYLDMYDLCKESLDDLKISLDELLDMEPDPAIGNGGLGRLAACFLDSMASIGLAGNGCGIRYRYGLFKQKIVNGYQTEEPEDWLNVGETLDFRKEGLKLEVRFGGHITVGSENGKLKFYHNDYESVYAVPYDVPIIGYRNNVVNTLRLFSAESTSKDFDFASFSHGDYLKAIAKKSSIEAISQVLYPDDSNYENKLLRLKQQYFLVSAGIKSIIRTYKKKETDMRAFYNQVAIHLNDTHPTLAVCELMRILLDEEGLGWEEAWDITTRTISYTNHTIMPEALEKWPCSMMKQLLPRIYMIIDEINRRFYEYVKNNYGENMANETAIIKDSQVFMANLEVVASHSVNGVAKLHTEILKNEVMKNFNYIFPNKFNNKTNGITHRRFLLKANKKLSSLISNSIGDEWICNPMHLKELHAFKDDSSFIEKLLKVKIDNKKELSKFIYEKTNIEVDPNSIFDCQIKRFHSYKRQLLNVFNIMYLYNEILKNPNFYMYPRTFIFSGKAARGYYEAKETIKLINTLADMINNDTRIKNKIKVIFLEDYRVSIAEKIITAAEVSEQISTASKEASGTGNMKFMMNGAITIGTMDGANVEIYNEVGPENIFIFGLTAKEVISYYKNGGYISKNIYEKDKELKVIVDNLINGFFPVKEEEFRMIYNSLIYDNDNFFVLKDFRSYVETQKKLEKTYENQMNWGKMSLINIANSGTFSSDRSIREYADEIWGVDYKD